MPAVACSGQRRARDGARGSREGTGDSVDGMRGKIDNCQGGSHLSGLSNHYIQTERGWNGVEIKDGV